MGRGGGLVALWQSSCDCELVNFSNNHIDWLIYAPERENWRLTCYNGYPESSRRRDACDFLCSLANQSSTPWCILGDFNDLLSSLDKHGPHPHPEWLLQGF